MPDGATPTLSPKEAIARGRAYFNELMSTQQTPRVLLEGLRLDESAGNWVVTFGFDSERPKPQPSSPVFSALSKSIMMKPEMELLREFRAVYLSAVDGKFIKLAHA